MIVRQRRRVWSGVVDVAGCGRCVRAAGAAGVVGVAGVAECGKCGRLHLLSPLPSLLETDPPSLLLVHTLTCPRTPVPWPLDMIRLAVALWSRSLPVPSPLSVTMRQANVQTPVRPGGPSLISASVFPSKRSSPLQASHPPRLPSAKPPPPEPAPADPVLAAVAAAAAAALARVVAPAAAAAAAAALARVVAPAAPGVPRPRPHAAQPARPHRRAEAHAAAPATRVPPRRRHSAQPPCRRRP
eukprot:357798-Chlamydomonas_euryale.AAC.20